MYLPFYHCQTEVVFIYAILRCFKISEQVVHVNPKFFNLLGYVSQAKNLLLCDFTWRNPHL
jgi:hypothetical protein